ncbi:MAG: ABC transporter permease subunit [Pseudomonadota bacterium]
MIEILIQNWAGFSRGALVTLHLTLWVWLIGLLLGVPFGWFRGQLVNRSGEAGVSLIFLALGSVPVLVYLFWFHFPVQEVLGVVWPPFITSALVLGIFNSFMVSDVVRSALAEFPKEYEDVARTNGLSYRTYLREIKGPLILISSLPAYLATQVAAMHTTLFASLISVEELFRQAQRINSVEYKPVEIYSVLILFYFAFSFPLMLASRFLERRFNKFRRPST